MSCRLQVWLAIWVVQNQKRLFNISSTVLPIIDEFVIFSENNGKDMEGPPRRVDKGVRHREPRGRDCAGQTSGDDLPLLQLQVGLLAWAGSPSNRGGVGPAAWPLLLQVKVGAPHHDISHQQIVKVHKSSSEYISHVMHQNSPPSALPWWISQRRVVWNSPPRRRVGKAPTRETGLPRISHV